MAFLAGALLECQTKRINCLSIASRQQRLGAQQNHDEAFDAARSDSDANCRYLLPGECIRLDVHDLPEEVRVHRKQCPTAATAKAALAHQQESTNTNK